jgi:hypothetical protein
MALVLGIAFLVVITVVISLPLELLGNRLVSIVGASAILWVVSGLIAKNFVLYMSGLGGNQEPSMVALVFTAGLWMLPIWAPVLAIVQFLLHRANPR